MEDKDLTRQDILDKHLTNMIEEYNHISKKMHGKINFLIECTRNDPENALMLIGLVEALQYLSCLDRVLLSGGWPSQEEEKEDANK